MPVFFSPCFFDRNRLYSNDKDIEDNQEKPDGEFDFELSLKEKIFCFLTNSSGLPAQSLKFWAKLFDCFTCVMVLFAVVLFLISSLPQHRSPNKVPKTLEGLQIFTFIYFSIEYLPKLLLAGWCRWDVLNTALYYPNEETYAEDGFQFRKIWKILIDPLLLIALLATLPFWIGLSMGQGDIGGFSIFLRLLRLTRVARVIQLFVKSSRFRQEGALLYKTLTKTTHQLFRLFVYYSLAALVIGTLIFYVEKGELMTVDGVEGYFVKDVAGDYSPAMYSSVFDGAWWFLITGTSVGYGDVYPKTHIGRIISVFAIMIGLIAIALPIGMIQAQFQILHFQEAQKDKSDWEGDGSALGDLKKILDDRDDKLLRKFMDLLDARDSVLRIPSSEKLEIVDS